MPAVRAREAPSTILVADEDPRIVELVGALLRAAGYRVVTAVGAGEARLAGRASTVDLIVADERVCAAKALPPGAPLLILSASADEESCAPCVLAKPFHVARLLDKVEEALRRRSP